MIRRDASFALVAALLTAATSCSAPRREPSRAPGSGAAVAVTDAWARSTPSGAGTGALYFTLASPDGDRLIGVSVPTSVAAGAQMHRMIHMPAGYLTMQRTSEVELPSGRAIRFAPGGRHVMLLQLARPLAVGDSIEVTLRFERAAPVVVQAHVRDE